MRRVLWIICATLYASLAVGQEVQVHGVSFEKWVCETFFDGYVGDYTQKWDVPENHPNTSEQVPGEGLPVSIKLVRYKSPIGLGDILRQRKLNQEFLMIVGFWEQKSETEKWIVEIECLHIKPKQWNKLWGELTAEKIEHLDQIVKDTSINYQLARTRAQHWKKVELPDLNCRMVVNPKIGSTGQRRVQCSMPHSVFWQLAGREPKSSDQVALLGKAFPNPIYSKPRTFKAE